MIKIPLQTGHKQTKKVYGRNMSSDDLCHGSKRNMYYDKPEKEKW